MAKVAVTGSNGFVGGNIANMLLAAGHEVIGLVRSQPDSTLPWQTVVVDLSSTPINNRGDQRLCGDCALRYRK